jgi:hypothetical protein
MAKTFRVVHAARDLEALGIRPFSESIARRSDQSARYRLEGQRMNVLIGRNEDVEFTLSTLQ